LERALDVNIRAASFLDSNFIADLDLETGNVYLATIDRDMTVTHKLARLRARCGIAKTINDVVQAALEKGEQVFARYAFHTNGPLEVEPELSFQHAVYSLDLLFLAKLFAVTYELRPANIATVLTWRLSAAFLDWAARLIAPLAL
jgi:hypothetical protein